MLNNLDGISNLMEWIEKHPISVDLLKWATLLVVAYISGLFKVIAKYTRKPSISLIHGASRCYIESIQEFEGEKKAVRAAFLVDITVRNPQEYLIVVESFSLSYKSERFLFSRSPEFHPITMPNRPRQEMGSGTKYSKVFFSNIVDGCEGLTMSGELSAKNFQNGYLLFVSSTFGSWNPKITKDHVRVRISCQLTTGETLESSALVQITRNSEQFEKWMPGIIDQIRHGCAWNAIKK